MIQGASFCGWMGGREAPWKEETFEEALELGGESQAKAQAHKGARGRREERGW